MSKLKYSIIFLVFFLLSSGGLICLAGSADEKQPQPSQSSEANEAAASTSRYDDTPPRLPASTTSFAPANSPSGPGNPPEAIARGMIEAFLTGRRTELDLPTNNVMSQLLLRSTVDAPAGINPRSWMVVQLMSQHRDAIDRLAGWADLANLGILAMSQDLLASSASPPPPAPSASLAPPAQAPAPSSSSSTQAAATTTPPRRTLDLDRSLDEMTRGRGRRRTTTTRHYDFDASDSRPRRGSFTAPPPSGGRQDNIYRRDEYPQRPKRSGETYLDYYLPRQFAPGERPAIVGTDASVGQSLWKIRRTHRGDAPLRLRIANHFDDTILRRSSRNGRTNGRTWPYQHLAPFREALGGAFPAEPRHPPVFNETLEENPWARARLNYDVVPDSTNPYHLAMQRVLWQNYYCTATLVAGPDPLISRAGDPMKWTRPIRCHVLALFAQEIAMQWWGARLGLDASLVSTQLAGQIWVDMGQPSLNSLHHDLVYAIDLIADYLHDIRRLFQETGMYDYLAGARTLQDLLSNAWQPVIASVYPRPWNLLIFEEFNRQHLATTGQHPVLNFRDRTSVIAQMTPEQMHAAADRMRRVNRDFAANGEYEVPIGINTQAFMNLPAHDGEPAFDLAPETFFLLFFFLFFK
eukprot:GHVU01204240.1.p1 GENE.GHVU01204240.1~~GHVU01204240.1.p1  ORF type:complete len:635 (-),score=71.99 GHVU01204240.1:592-2496(-)